MSKYYQVATIYNDNLSRSEQREFNKKIRAIKDGLDFTIFARFDDKESAAAMMKRIPVKHRKLFTVSAMYPITSSELGL